MEFDFGNDQKAEDSKPDPKDFIGQEPLGKCPKCAGRVFEASMNYVCESGDFKTGRIILQKAIERAQVQKLLATGKTDLINGFVSNRTHRTFNAFLVLKEGKVGFEFEPRPARGAKSKAPKAPPVKIDFTGQESLGKCPKCGGRVFEGPESFVCERSQAETRACKFKIGKTIAQQPIDRTQAGKILAANRSDLLTQFISRYGKPFSAWLVLDDAGKVTFEFPERGSETKAD